MMTTRVMSYANYLDKVYGAWLGKSIAGTIGAPYEGRKERFQYEYDPKAIEEMFANDDLDLQVLWLEVMEEKGVEITSMDLADAFYKQCPYAPGEYASFMKNYARGIYPPYSGGFNNRYYVNGMGCPIRSEVWACISPGNPALAAAYAALDGVMDHEGDSVYAEQCLAAMEAAAFFEGDLQALLEVGLTYLPEGSRIRSLALDTIRWCGEQVRWEDVRALILRDYGHPDCTNLYQNIGFTLLSLLKGNGDFIATTMIALNCGFDTDCSCATAGALLGIIHGAAALIEKHRFYDTSYKLSVDVVRSSNKLEDLAIDTCRVGLAVAAAKNPLITITDAPDIEPLPVPRAQQPVEIGIDYGEVPVIAIGQPKTVTLLVRNATLHYRQGTLKLELPEGWSADGDKWELELHGTRESQVKVAISVPESTVMLSEHNRLAVSWQEPAHERSRSFGLNGAQQWDVYGPYWRNVATLPPTELGEWYYPHFKQGPNGTKNEMDDLVRQYHLNTLPDEDEAHRPTVGNGSGRKESAKARDGAGASDSPGVSAGAPAAELEPQRKQIVEDRILFSDLIGFQGPCTIWAVRRIHSPEDRTVHLQVGHTDAYSLWLNGELVSESEQADWWTAENRHHEGIALRQGENVMLAKLTRRSREAEFSFIFTEKGTCTKQIWDLGSYV